MQMASKPVTSSASPPGRGSSAGSPGPGRGARRVQAAEFGPGDRDHLAGGVQLHGADPSEIIEWSSARSLFCKDFEIAQHLVFGAVGVEHRVGEDGVVAHQAGRQGGSAAATWASMAPISR